ncbi:MAG: PLP-dependent aminotransferase family protein [Longimicrobiales bacterium]
MRRARAVPVTADAQRPPRTSRVGAAILTTTHAAPTVSGAPRPFRLGEPGFDSFPRRAWSRLLAQHARRTGAELLTCGDPNGYRLLRRAILECVAAARGVHAELDQVFLVRGTQAAVDLIARLLLNPGEAAWVEDPGYLSTRAILTANGIQLAPVPVDAAGLVVAEGVRSCANARAAFVTPSDHFPLSATLTLTRRMELLAWALQHNAWVIEDDYDSEFHYSVRPLPCLQGLDRSGNVLYIGTFSKTMFSALRLGYLVVPPQLVALFERARDRLDAIAPNVEQAALAEFIGSGAYARHVRRMRGLYLERQSFLVEQIREQLSPWLRAQPVNVGMQLVAWLQDELGEARAVQLAAAAQVDLRPLSLYSLQHRLAPGLVLGFASYDQKESRSAVQRLASAFSRC